MIPLDSAEFLRDWTVEIRRFPICCQCPDSEVRNTVQQALMRTSESKGHQQVYDSSVAFGFEVPIRDGCKALGTSNPPH
jgi:hypothetical protein